MSVLPDELWRHILEIGIKTPTSLSCRDLCCVAITCRRLNRLSNEYALWSFLLSSDFSQYGSYLSSSTNTNPSPKALYKDRLESARRRRLVAYRRAVLIDESQIAEHSRKLQEIELLLAEESEKLKVTIAELSNLYRVRQASVALNVWQPEVVRGRQKQIVEQCIVPVDSRINALEMEVKLCKLHIAGFDKAHRGEKRRLDAAKQQLASMKYHPLWDLPKERYQHVRDYSSTSSRDDESSIKRKKLEKCINSHVKQGNTSDG